MKAEYQKALNIKGQKILIIGNRSYRNMGDELILLWTVKLLLEQKRQITISCFDPIRLKTFFSQFIDITQITFIYELPKGFRSTFQRIKKGWLKQLKSFRKTDAVILWGGEIITEENPSAYRYRLVGMRPFLLRVIASEPKAKRGNPDQKKSLYIMWWIQIPKNSRNKKLFRFLLNRTTHLYLRDFQAVEEIKKFGYSNTDFFMDTSFFSYSRNEVKKENKSEKYIVVNLNKNGEQFLDEIAQDIQIYLQKGYTIYYVPVAKGHNIYYNDLQYKEKLEQLVIASEGKAEAKQSKKNIIETLDWEKDFQHFTELVKNAEIVISTRLHLFLIASFLGTKTKVYPYQRKILKMQEVIKKVL